MSVTCGIKGLPRGAHTFFKYVSTAVAVIPNSICYTIVLVGDITNKGEKMQVPGAGIVEILECKGDLHLPFFNNNNGRICPNIKHPRLQGMSLLPRVFEYSENLF